ncbi:MAG: ATP-binding protein [Rhodospirillales bacterium]|nr:ATP-binding protein [Rhodospirillales bacterium]
MLTSVVLVLSVLLQALAAFLSLRRIRQSGRYLWAWGCLSSALSLMAVRRLISLFDAIDRGSAGGNLPAEVTALAISLLMVGGVIGLGRLLDAVERQRAELDRVVNELRRSNKELEQFAYIASHDLNEPLRMISSYLGLIERRLGDRLDGEIKEFMNYALDGATRMRALIDGLLEYSRVGRKGEPRDGLDLNILLAEALADLKPAITQADAEVTVDNLPTVRGVESELRRTFLNLIGNALKFHAKDRKPKIHVSATAKEGVWEFLVADNGIGIEPKHFEQVFQMFKRLHGQSEYPGTGLGLALAKRIVDTHGGRIWIESQPGQGSTFRFTLPKN